MGVRKACGQRTRLVTTPSYAAKMQDVKTLLPQFKNNRGGNARCFVGAVIEKLDMQLGAWPFQCSNGSQTTRDHSGFIKDRDLDENMRKVIFMQPGFWERLAKQAAGRLLKDIDADENEKADADEQKTADGGN